MTDSAASPPVACTLTADQIRCQSRELLPGLVTRASAAEWTTMGMRLEFAATSENIAAITHTVDRERVCCAFLDFVLRVPHSGGEVILEVSGPDGTRSFLEGLGLSI